MFDFRLRYAPLALALLIGCAEAPAKPTTASTPQTWTQICTECGRVGQNYVGTASPNSLPRQPCPGCGGQTRFEIGGAE